MNDEQNAQAESVIVGLEQRIIELEGQIATEQMAKAKLQMNLLEFRERVREHFTNKLNATPDCPRCFEFLSTDHGHCPACGKSFWV